MHGLILAGGEGRRLAEDGVREPKALMPIGGRPQLAVLVDTFRALGCETVTCMLRKGVADVVSADHPDAVRVLECETPSSFHTLALGFAALPAGPVFCTMVDTVMPWHNWVRAWMACTGALAQGAPAVLVVGPVPPDDPQPLCVHTDASGHLVRLDDDHRSAEWATAGVYGFGQVARARAPLAIADGVERMRGFLSLLVREGASIPLVTVDLVLDVDRRKDLDAANAWAASLPSATPSHGGKQ